MTDKKGHEPLQTILVIVTGLAFVYLARRWDPVLYAMLAIGCTGLLSAKLARIIDMGWMKLAGVMSLIGPAVLLTAIFYLVLLPLSLLSRLFRKSDPLMLANKADSTFVTRTRKIERSHFEQPW